MNLLALSHLPSYCSLYCTFTLHTTIYNQYSNIPKLPFINVQIYFICINSSPFLSIMPYNIILNIWKFFHILSYKCPSKGKYRWLLNRTLNSITFPLTRIMRVTRICQVYLFILIFFPRCQSLAHSELHL